MKKNNNKLSSTLASLNVALKRTRQSLTSNVQSLNINSKQLENLTPQEKLDLLMTLSPLYTDTRDLLQSTTIRIKNGKEE